MRLTMQNHKTVSVGEECNVSRFQIENIYRA
jgi:hypothetical protein